MKRQFLSQVPLFSNLSPEDLDWLGERVSEVRISAGTELFHEGESGQKAYVICEGELEVLKESQDRDLLLAVRKPGDVIGEIALLEDAPRMATILARTDSLLLAIDKAVLDELMQNSHTALQSLFRNIMNRLRDTQSHLQQSEKMAQLGVLTAGVAHELNNPASAMQRAQSRLANLWGKMQDETSRLYGNNLTNEQDVRIQSMLQGAGTKTDQMSNISGLERSDRRDLIQDWLESNLDWNPSGEVLNALIDIDLSSEDLQGLVELFSGPDLQLVLSIVAHSYLAHQLLNEIKQSSKRISDIVSALKGYIYLDQAPIQDVDVREGIEDTLLIFNYKLNKGVEVVKEFATDLPKIPAFASELNQVWTNLIDNAIHAMDGKGKLRVGAYQQSNWVIVEIEDSGPGIPEEIKQKVFDAFFTTKEPGEGTGMGLFIAYGIVVEKHHGDLKVFSEPGRTTFQVWLPVDASNLDK